MQCLRLIYSEVSVSLTQIRDEPSLGGQCSRSRALTTVCTLEFNLKRLTYVVNGLTYHVGKKILFPSSAGRRITLLPQNKEVTYLFSSIC